MTRHILQAGFRFRCFNAVDDPARSNGGDRSGDLDGRVAIPRVWRKRALIDRSYWLRRPLFELQPAFQKFNGPLTAVCDICHTRAEKAQAANAGAKIFDDHRKLLEMPGLGAAIIATSDHWHAAIAIEAANAGKDLYVESHLRGRLKKGCR